MKIAVAAVACLFFLPQFVGAEPMHISALQGLEVNSGQTITADLNGRKGVVVVFLSAVCPCSNSHVSELAALSKEHSDFAFYGVHSNADEGKELSQNYFQAAKLPFPIIADSVAKIADSYRPKRTPHAYVVLTNGEVVYQGGVSSSQDFGSAEHRYLRDALEDIKQNKRVKNPRSRPLGCEISRGK